MMLKEIFTGIKADEKTDKEADDKQPDITDIPDLESEESVDQRRNQIKISIKNTNTESNAQQITFNFSTIKSWK